MAGYRALCDCLPFFLPHLFEGISNVEGTDFLIVLKFQEFVASVSGHIYENVGTVISQEAF